MQQNDSLADGYVHRSSIAGLAAPRPAQHRSDVPRHCHSADTLSRFLLKRLLKWEGVAAEPQHRHCRPGVAARSDDCACGGSGGARRRPQRTAARRFSPAVLLTAASVSESSELSEPFADDDERQLTAAVGISIWIAAVRPLQMMTSVSLQPQWGSQYGLQL